MATRNNSATHAAHLDAGYDWVFSPHIGKAELWQRSLGKLPTTDPDVAYGTPDMANELDRLYRFEGFKAAGVAVLAGHDEGLISFGTTLEEAAQRILRINANPG